jgi:hypothetical protein
MGRITKPTAKTAKVDSSAVVSLPGAKNWPAKTGANVA